jgi:hypothetical protein
VGATPAPIASIARIIFACGSFDASVVVERPS